MAYTPPTNPVRIDFNRSPYFAPVNPVHLEFDREYSENLTRILESVTLYEEQSASTVVFADAAASALAKDDAAASFVVTLGDSLTVGDACAGDFSHALGVAETLLAADQATAYSALTASINASCAVSDNQTIERFSYRISTSWCAPVAAATPVAAGLAAPLDRVGIGRREVLARFQQGQSIPIALCAPLDVLVLTMTKFCNVQQNTAALTLPIAATLDQLSLQTFKTCAATDAAAGLSAGFAAPINVSSLDWGKVCATVDDTRYSYHAVLRTVYDDPAQPYVPGGDFVISPSSSVIPTTVIWQRYVPPPDAVVMNFDPVGYVPPSPTVDLNFGDKDLTAIAHVFNVAPGYYPAYVTSSDFVLPYTTQSHIVREVEQIGVLRGKACSPLEDFTLSRDKLCSWFDNARRPPPGSSAIVIDPPRDPPPKPTITYAIPQRNVYMINHVITTTLLDGTPVPLETLSLSLDADSFAWSFRGRLADKDAIALVQQPLNADPIQLVITVNGVVFNVIVERIDHNRQFGDRQILLNGRSLTALLGQPYQQPTSATQASDLTVQQLADLQLPEHWSINWDLPAWLVPNGAFSYTAQTPIQVLMSIATDIGAVIKPHRTAKSMTFQRRYKVGPWQFGQAVADLTIPEAAIGSLSLRPTTPIDINGVYVHGGDVGGVIGWCRLSGTDGAKLAQTVNNSLMTDVDGARLLGERILAANQPQPAIQSLTVPMDGVDFPLVELGWLVQVTVDNVPIRGIVNAVSLDVAFGSVRQTIQIGEETPNNWSSFRDLLPRDPLLVGTVSVTDGLSSLVTLLDGGVVRVRGTGTVGSKYYLRAGRIETEAPNLNQAEIVI